MYTQIFYNLAYETFLRTKYIFKSSNAKIIIVCIEGCILDSLLEVQEPIPIYISITHSIRFVYYDAYLFLIIENLNSFY